MARRRILQVFASHAIESTDTAIAEQRSATVYYDSQWQDNIVEYYKHDKKLEGASSHHYDDREDAQQTAFHWAQGK